jgi:hypothetical protein
METDNVLRFLWLAAISLERRIKLCDGRLDWKRSDGILGYWARRRHTISACRNPL